MLFSKNVQGRQASHWDAKRTINISISIDVKREKHSIQKLCNEISEFTPCQVIVFSSEGETVASSLECRFENTSEQKDVFDKDILPLTIDDVVIGYLVISGPEMDILKYSFLITKYIETSLSVLIYKNAHSMS